MGDGPFSQPAPEAQRNYLPLIAGALVVALVIGAVVLLGRRPAENTRDLPLDPYAANLALVEPHLSSAHNFVGATVYYVDGKIVNTGDKTVTGVRVEAIFRNSLGEVVGKEVVPIMLLHARPGYDDLVPLSAAPLTPNQAREFRLTFERISADWNQGYPELRAVRVTTE